MGTSLLIDATTYEPVATDRSDDVAEIFYTSKSDDDQMQNTSSPEETNNSDDDAYVIPIKVILHAEHVHRSSGDNETFLKFNYILMRTNETSYHGHFETDEMAERFKLLRNDNYTNVQFNVTEQPDGVSETSSVSPISILVNANGDQYVQLNERIIVNDDGVIVIRFNEIAWKREDYQYQETNTQPIVDKNQDLSEDRAMSSESDQENDRHYSQILPWIHFNL